MTKAKASDKPNQTALPYPKLMLFDWHGTLVDTHGAMYESIQELLDQLDELDLIRHILPEESAKTEDDEKLIRYIRIYRQLQPRVLAERRISRTDIFEVLFGDNEAATSIAHKAYNECYRRHYGSVKPFQAGLYHYLAYLKNLGVKLGVVTNRSREFLDLEMSSVEGGRWQGLFDTTLCGDEMIHYKPAGDAVVQATNAAAVTLDKHVWYVGDSITDMLCAANAKVTPVFYNGAHWSPDWFRQNCSPRAYEHCRPAAIVNDFDELLDVVLESEAAPFAPAMVADRPERLPPRAPQPKHQEPDWHPALAKLSYPKVILFDWHATLVDTLDAMYRAVDDLLNDLREMKLLEQLVDASQCKSPDDQRLVEYVRQNLKLHPKIKHDRKISRTDIFEILFADNEVAKKLAHKAFTDHYRKYFGTALPFEPKVRHMLEGLRSLGITIGVITNRDREFLMHEINTVDGGWAHLFDTEICGDDTEQRKPHPDQIYKAAENLGCTLGPDVWYVGDSTTDVVAAKTAGITSVFFNGAQWDLPWLNKIFPGNERFPCKPDVVVNDFSEFWAMVLSCRSRQAEHGTPLTNA